MFEKKPLQPGAIVEFDIIDPGDGNRAFGRLDTGMGAFVRGVHVPGDRIRAQVTKVKKRHAELTFLELLVPSPDRIEASCPHFGRCGGCRWQEVSMERQASLKQKMVRDALERLGGFKGIEVDEVRTAPAPYRYRNKLEFVFSRNQANPSSDSKWSLGFHIQGVSNSVLNIEDCHLASPAMNELAQQVKAYLEPQSWQAHDLKREAGLLRSLMIRESSTTGQLMVNLITSGPMPNPTAFVAALQEGRDTPIQSIVNAIAPRKNRIQYERVDVLDGTAFIEETILGSTFQVSAASFLQPNSAQAEKLYEEVVRLAACQSTDKVLDLYCGIGTLTLQLAKHAELVLGVESIDDAVEDAHDNAERNHVENAQFQRQILGHEEEEVTFPSSVDVIVTDPPRDGMTPDVVDAIRTAAPRRIVYVSCHPASLARDAQRLCADGLYTLDTVTPFDHFPQTAHIETIAVFNQK